MFVLKGLDSLVVAIRRVMTPAGSEFKRGIGTKLIIGKLLPAMSALEQHVLVLAVTRDSKPASFNIIAISQEYILQQRNI